jgi:cellulose synthase/poly-beta-1,6-N-acetylglucosamine synthase-like glycosyltransferase
MRQRMNLAVIVPCKGRDDAHFEDNLVRMINQQYAGPVQFVFSVESDVDPALPVLQSLARQFENVWVCVAGLATQCSQKVFNILQGMACITDIDIFLIADADIQPHHTWLQEMVAPFSDPDIGAVTGYYRRLPLKPHFQLGDYLLGLSNACLTITMSDNRYRSLWGGSMAIRESIMDKHNLYQWLSTEIVDDMALMQALRQYRIKRHYTPSCTVKSYCDMSLHNSIEWQVRQFQYLQIYAKYGLYLIVVATFPYIFLILAIPFIFIYGRRYRFLVFNHGTELAAAPRYSGEPRWRSPDRPRVSPYPMAIGFAGVCGVARMDFAENNVTGKTRLADDGLARRQIPRQDQNRAGR